MEFLSAKYLNGLAKAKVGEKFLQDKPRYGKSRSRLFMEVISTICLPRKVYSDVRLVGAPPSSIGKVRGGYG